MLEKKSGEKAYALYKNFQIATEVILHKYSLLKFRILNVKENVIFSHRLKNSNYILELIVEPLGTVCLILLFDSSLFCSFV